MITRWDCERCGASGAVRHRASAGVWEVLNAIWNKHTNAAYSTQCYEGPTAIRVRIDADQMYPPRRTTRKGRKAAA